MICWWCQARWSSKTGREANVRGSIDILFLLPLDRSGTNAMPGATLAADTEESNSEDEDVDGQDGQDGHVADTGHEGEHGSRDGHSQTDGEGYTEFSGVSPTSAMYEDDFSQVSPDSGALSPSSPSSPLSPGDAAADMALAAVGTARGDATEPSQRSPASPASRPWSPRRRRPKRPGQRRRRRRRRRKRRRRRSMGTTSKIGHKMRSEYACGRKGPHCSVLPVATFFPFVEEGIMRLSRFSGCFGWRKSDMKGLGWRLLYHQGFFALVVAL